MTKHLMIDLETMSTRGNAAILSIGACLWNIKTGEILETFHRNINLNTSIEKGLHIDGSTIYWWFQQTQEARDALITTPRHIDTVMREFTKWLKYFETEKDINLNKLNYWANSPDFDISILRSSYTACDSSFPLNFWNVRCVRTIKGFYPDNLFRDWKLNNPRKGVHNALEDAKYQAKYVTHILNELGVEELY